MREERAKGGKEAEKPAFQEKCNWCPLSTRQRIRLEYRWLSAVIYDSPEIVNEKTAMFFRRTALGVGFNPGLIQIEKKLTHFIPPEVTSLLLVVETQGTPRVFKYGVRLRALPVGRKAGDFERGLGDFARGVRFLHRSSQNPGTSLVASQCRIA